MFNVIIIVINASFRKTQLLGSIVLLKLCQRW